MNEVPKEISIHYPTVLFSEKGERLGACLRQQAESGPGRHDVEVCETVWLALGLRASTQLFYSVGHVCWVRWRRVSAVLSVRWFGVVR